MIHYSTRTMHAHDALRRAAPVHMCALYMQVGHVEQMSKLKNDYLACEDSTACFLLLHFLLFSSCPLSFYCIVTTLQALSLMSLYYLCLSQCRQPSAAFSTRLCKTCTLRRTNLVLPVLHCQEVPFFPVLHR